MKLQEVFPAEYVSLVKKHASRIGQVVASYDIVIFMARKAICLYKAFLENDELKFEHHSLVLSSRVITFEILPMLKGKKIAVIDDVVVRGKSIKYVMDCISQAGLTADVFVMACEKESEDQKVITPYIASAPQYMDKEDINRFSNYITKYIHLSGIPYNIDFPVYKICFSSEEEVKRFFDDNYCQNLTDGAMREYGVERYTLNCDEGKLGCSKLLGIEESIISKIRFYYKKNDDSKTDDNKKKDGDGKKIYSVVAVPFVLLPELENDSLNAIYNKVIGNNYDDLISNRNSSFKIENRFKLLQYVLSDCLLINFANQKHISHIRKDSWNEKIIFSRKIDNSTICEEFILPVKDRVFHTDIAFSDNWKLNEYLNVFYDYLLFSDKSSSSLYYDGFGNTIKERIIDKSSIQDYYNYRGITITDSQISCFFDLAIDKGLLVPSIVHKNNTHTVRVYKLGEIYKLHKEGIELFHYMLYTYFELQNEQALDRTELEKLCVLYLKKTTYGSGFFKACEKFEDDCFSIGFSKFGPRVSDSDKVYTVHHYSALSTIMEYNDMIHLSKKYKINPASPPQKKSWRTNAQYFAYDYYKLKVTYESIIKNSEPLARTYNSFITLLAIGIEKKNYLYALVAELMIFERAVEKNKSLKDIIFNLDHYEYTSSGTPVKYKGIMDAINSGVWKYLCYQDSELVERIFEKLLQGDFGLHQIHEDYTSLVDNVDANSLYDTYIMECGELLLEIAFAFNSIVENTGERLGYPDKRCQKLKYLKIADDSNIKSDQMSEKIATLDDEQIVAYLIELKEKCRYLIDKCDLCVEQVSLQYSEIKDNIRIVYDPNHAIPNYTTDRVFKINDKDSALIDCVVLKNTESTFTETALSYQKYLKKGCRIVLINASMNHQYHGAIINGNQIAGSHLIACLEEILPNMIEPLPNGIYCISVYESDCDPLPNESGISLLRYGQGTNYKYGLYQLTLDEGTLKRITTVSGFSPIQGEYYFKVKAKLKMLNASLKSINTECNRQMAQNANVPALVAEWKQYSDWVETAMVELTKIEENVLPEIPMSDEEYKQYIETLNNIQNRIYNR